MIQLGPIYFAKAVFLVGTAFSIILWFILSRILKNHKRKVDAFLSPAKQREIFVGINWVRFQRGLARISLAAVFCFIALARPQWGEREEERKTNGLDIFIAVDVSNSMEAEDVVPSRLKKVKYILKLLTERTRGDRLGLVAFAGNAQVVSPLTNDMGYFREMVEALSPEMVANQGTDIGAALVTSLQALNRGAEELGTSDSESTGSRIILLVTDGEDHEENIESVLDQLKKTGTTLYAFGVGTEKGGPIPVRDPNGMIVGYKRDKKGETVVTRFTGTALLDMTKSVHGKFWAIGNGEKEVDDFFVEMGSLSQNERKEKKVRIREERFQFPLVIAVFILMFEFLPRRSRALKNATASVALFFFQGVFTSAFAQTAAVKNDAVSEVSVATEGPSLSVYLKNKKALEALEKKEVGRAKELLSEAQLESPNLPGLQYNQAEMHAAEGEEKKAAEVFEASGAQSRDLNRPDVSGPSYFNAGVVQGQKKETKSAAIQNYLQAIEEGKKVGDEELIRKARKNLHFLLDPNQQGSGGDSESEEKDPDKADKGEGSKSGKNQSDSNGEQKNEEKKESDKDGKKEMPSRYDGLDQKKKFKSSALSQEAANQVMNELSEKERQLQEKLQKQKGRPQSLEKDW